MLTLTSCQECPRRFLYSWESLGPFEISGAIRHVIADPTSSNRLYAAAENGGVWVLDDATLPKGGGWRPLSDRLENLQMRGLAISSIDTSHLVAANALGFVYQTSDRGAHWRRISDQNFLYVRRILITEGLTRVPAGNYTKLAKRTTLWVASRAGLWRLQLDNDSLVASEQLFPTDSTQGSDVLDVVQHPTNPDLMFVGVRGSGVWKTENGGEDWALSVSWLACGDEDSPMIKLAINSTRVVAKLGRFVLINDSAGNPSRWTTTSPVPYRSGDNGGSDIGYRGNYSGRVGEWVHAVAIDPTDSKIIAVGQTALFVTTNGGGNWTEVSSGHEDIQSLAFSPTGDRLTIATDGGIFQRIMSTGTIRDLNIRLTTAQLYRAAISGNATIGNADHQGILGSRNINAPTPVWEQAAGRYGYGNHGLEDDFIFGDPTTTGRYFIALHSQHLLRFRYPQTGSDEDLLPFNPTDTELRPFTKRTSNSTVNNRLNYPVGTLAFDPRPSANIMLTSSHETLNSSFSIRLTRDAGANPHGGPGSSCGDEDNSTFCFEAPVTNTPSWSLSHGPVNRPIVSIAFSPTEARKVYALNERGQVIAKQDIDDASPWFNVGNFPVNAGDAARQLLPDVSTPGTLYALTNATFMASTDSGRTWSRRGVATLPAGKLNAMVTHPTRTRVIYLATDTSVVVSGTGGSTWEFIDQLLPNAPVMQLFIDGGYLYAVTFGRGLWRAKLPT